MAARNVWEDMPRECAVATMMDVEYADGEELYRRLRSVDADWDEINKFAEDDELDHFMRAWFLVPPHRRVTLIRDSANYLGDVLTPVHWRTRMLERDDVRMMRLVENISSESGGQGKDGTYLVAAMAKCLPKCRFEFARDPAQLRRALKYLWGEGRRLDDELLLDWMKVAASHGHEEEAVSCIDEMLNKEE